MFNAPCSNINGGTLCFIYFSLQFLFAFSGEQELQQLRVLHAIHLYQMVTQNTLRTYDEGK